MVVVTSSSDAGSSGETNYNQLDRIVVQVNETEEINPTTETLSRVFTRRHSGVKDFEITVPELLLKQQQRTKDIFNIVLEPYCQHNAYSRGNRDYEYNVCSSVYGKN